MTDETANEGGTPFDFPLNKSGVEKITIAHGRCVDGLQLHYRDGTETDWVGGKGGTIEDFVIPKNDDIIRIQVQTGRVVDSMTFVTKRGIASKFGGKGRGTGNSGESTIAHHHPVPPYEFTCSLCGISGRSGRLIDSIEFKWAMRSKWAVQKTVASKVQIETSTASNESQNKKNIFGSITEGIQNLVVKGKDDDDDESSTKKTVQDDIGKTKYKLEETRDSLYERGDKLNALNDKSSDLRDSAQDFASMAKELRKRQEARGIF